MELTREREQDHRHFRFAEQEALSLKSGLVVVHQGENKEIIAEVCRYNDTESLLVWVCYETKSRSSEVKSLVVFRALESVLVDTWASCLGECRNV